MPGRTLVAVVLVVVSAAAAVFFAVGRSRLAREVESLETKNAELEAARRERDELTHAIEALRADNASVTTRLAAVEQEKVAAEENGVRTKALLTEAKSLLARAVEDGADPTRSLRLEKEARDATSLVERRESELAALRTEREGLSTQLAAAEARAKEAGEAQVRADAALQKSLASAPDAGRLVVLEREAADAKTRVAALGREVREATELAGKRERELAGLRGERDGLSTQLAAAEARVKEAGEAQARADAALAKSLASAPDAGRLALLEKEAADAKSRVSALDREVREAAQLAGKRERELEGLRGERDGLAVRIAALDAAQAKVQSLERDLAERVRREKEWASEKLRLEKRLAARESGSPVAPPVLAPEGPRPTMEIVRRPDGPLDVEGRVPVGSDLLVNGRVATVDSAGAFNLRLDVGPGRSVVLEQIDADGVVRYYTYDVPEPR